MALHAEVQYNQAFTLGGASTNLVVPKPSGTQAGEVLIAMTGGEGGHGHGQQKITKGRGIYLRDFWGELRR